MSIKGIDNDFAFGSNQGKYSNYGPPNSEYKSAPMPQLISASLAERIEKMEFESAIKPQLEGRLSNDEIAASRSRFEEMQKAVRDIPKERRIPDDGWDSFKIKINDQEEVVPEQFLQRNEGNLYKRDFAKLWS